MGWAIADRAFLSDAMVAAARTLHFMEKNRVEHIIFDRDGSAVGVSLCWNDG